jgi:acetyl esterase/lipase
MLESGFACAALDYRLAPQTRFPGQIEDLTQAVRYLLQNAVRLRLKPDGILLAGESAGGHLAAFLGAEHPDSLKILGVVAFSPPLDLEALGEPGRALGIIPPEVRALTGASGWTPADLDLMRRASPIHALRPNPPPFLIAFGTADALVPPSQSRAFCEKVRQTGGACQLLPIPGARHGLWTEDQFDRWKSVWFPTLLDWIARLPVDRLQKSNNPR